MLFCTVCTVFIFFTQRKFYFEKLIFSFFVSMDEFTTPVLPKGRGVWIRHNDNGGKVGRPYITSDTDSGFNGENVHTSTPSNDISAINQLTDMMGQLGAQIGESIVAKLMSAGVVNMSSNNQTSPPTHSTPCDSSKFDSPHVTVHVTPDRDLPSFKGDSTDKYSVLDWINLTKTYLKRRGTPPHEQAEEITSHLLGKARDIVKIALRGNSDTDVTKKPALIYDVLLRYFSDASSCLPLADFYSTLPKHKENPVDYWIRLNKAADRALEGLRRQGNIANELNNEIALMFVKHCPDPDLSSIFKWKSTHEWSLSEVQLRIDDYQREMRASLQTISEPQLKVHTAAVAPDLSCPLSVTPSAPVQSPQVSHSLSPDVPLQTLHFPKSPSSHAVQVLPGHASNTVPVMAQNLQQSEERLLSRMVEMFQEVMERVQPRGPRPAGGGGPSRARQRRPREPTCRVCGYTGHTTTSHCMSERLCFQCLDPGHTRLQCPANASRFPLPQSQGN